MSKPTDSGEREKLKKRLVGMCPPLNNLGLRAYQETLADIILDDRSRLLDELEKAGPKDTHLANISQTKIDTIFAHKNQTNAAWRSAIQALRTRGPS